MAVCLKSQLPRIRRPVFKSLCLTFQNKISAVFETSDRISAKGRLCSGQIVLCRMVNIRTCKGQRFCRLVMVNVRLHPVGIAVLRDIGPEFLPFKIQIVGNELIFPLVFPDQIRLPHQIIRCHLSLKRRKLRGKTAVDTASHVGEILPVMNRVAPVCKSEGLVQILRGLKFFFHGLSECGLYLPAHISVVFCLIINLESYYRSGSGRMFRQLSDNPLCVASEGRIEEIENLPSSVVRLSLSGFYQYTRIFPAKP